MTKGYVEELHLGKEGKMCQRETVTMAIVKSKTIYSMNEKQMILILI